MAANKHRTVNCYGCGSELEPNDERLICLKCGLDKPRMRRFYLKKTFTSVVLAHCESEAVALAEANYIDEWSGRGIEVLESEVDWDYLEGE